MGDAYWGMGVKRTRAEYDPLAPQPPLPQPQPPLPLQQNREMQVPVAAMAAPNAAAPALPPPMPPPPAAVTATVGYDPMERNRRIMRDANPSYDQRFPPRNGSMPAYPPQATVEGPPMAIREPPPTAPAPAVTGYRREEYLPAEASSTLFVEGLPASCSRREAAHIFRPFVGYKEVRLVTKEPRNPAAGGEPLVLCFVDFANPNCAATAMDALQGYKLDDKDRDSPSLRLQFARYPGPRGGGGGGGRRY